MGLGSFEGLPEFGGAGVSAPQFVLGQASLCDQVPSLGVMTVLDTLTV